MCKHRFVTAAVAFAAIAFSIPVLAQSSVTLYGITDIAVVSVSNKDGGRLTALESGILQSSRLGFRGVEDLGGGLNTLFVLESGMSLDTGITSSVFFNRQAYVGLSSKNLGTLSMGRQYGPIFDHLVGLSGAPAFGVQAGAIDGIALPTSTSSTARFENTIGSTRFDNSIKYTSPTLSGFRASALVGLGEVADSFSSRQTLSLGLGYNEGPTTLGIGYLTSKCPAATGCTPTQDDNKVFGIGGGYRFGIVKLSAVFTTQKNGKNVRGNDATVSSFIAQMPLGAWVLAAGYQTLNDKTRLNQNIEQFNLGVQYFLSKRTTAYALYSAQKVDNGGKASMALFTSNNEKQNIFGVGIRHTF